LINWRLLFDENASKQVVPENVVGDEGMKISMHFYCFVV
jgi:hypothetical protein